VHIFKLNDKKIAFIHVPKTGGLSIVNFLSKNGFESIHIEKNYNGLHTPYEILKDLELNYDFCFSVYRNPIDRFISTLNYFYSNIKNYDDFIFEEIEKFHNLNDNLNSVLFRPQVKYYSPNCKIIKFEELNMLKKFLKFNNIDTSGDLEIFNKKKKKKIVLSKNTINKLKCHFSEDYNVNIISFI
jgi:hypothetical protein